MNTWSHLLVNAALNRPIKKKQAETDEPKLPPMRTRWFIFGSILPDLMLILMGGGALIFDLVTGAFTLSDLANGPGNGNGGESAAFANSAAAKLFNDWYFTNPLVKTGHSIFGTPIMLIIYIAVGYFLWTKGRKWAPALFWLAVGCAIHVLVDIPLHTDDGPLIFWPLEWNYRFESPVSYWDPDHHGETWSQIELGLNAVLLLWLIGSWGWRRFRTEPSSG